MIKISKPKALIGEAVYVYNTRRGNRQDFQDGVWESGKIERAECHLNVDGTGWWHYTVRLDRRTPSKIDHWGRECGDNPLFVYATNEKIKKIK